MTETVTVGTDEYRFTADSSTQKEQSRFVDASGVLVVDEDRFVEKWDDNDMQELHRALKNVKKSHQGAAAHVSSSAPEERLRPYELQLERESRTTAHTGWTSQFDDHGGPICQNIPPSVTAKLLVDPAFNFVSGVWRQLHPLLMMRERDRPKQFLTAVHGMLTHMGLNLLICEIRHGTTILMVYKFNDDNENDQEELTKLYETDPKDDEELRNMTADLLRLTIVYAASPASESSRTMFASSEKLSPPSFDNFVVVLRNAQLRYGD